MIYSARENVIPPHTEDVIVHNATYAAEQRELRKFLTPLVRPWYGEADCLFNGLLIMKNKSAYISKHLSIPLISTGFWIPTKPLNLSNNPKYYSTDVKIKSQLYGDDDWSEELLIPYVGFAPPIPQIPANTLVRVSLARWWKPTGTNNERCYLQLSGWYL